MNALSTDEAALDVNTNARKPGFATKMKAKAAAVATIGEHARDGFEFETFKLDGRWHWRAFDVVKPPTAAEIKAMGGKRAFLTEATAQHERAVAEAEQWATHEERGRERAEAEGRLRVEPAIAVTVEVAAEKPRRAPRAAAGAPKAPEASQAPDAPESLSGGPVKRLSPAAEQLGRMGITDVAQWPSEGIAKRPADIPEEMPGAPSGDGLDLPEFLKRPKPTKEEAEALRKKLARTVGPERFIKNPSNVKQAKARAEKADGQSMAFVIKEAIKAGKTDEQALAILLKMFPSCGYKTSDVKWYRRKMAKASKAG